jgi:hypothetical protein
MNKFINILFLSCFIISCTSNTIIEKPDNLIPKDKMVDVITDLLIASGAKNIKNIHQQRDIDYYSLVFEKYQVDSTQFQESNYYYTSKIDDYDEMLAEVNNRLRTLKNKFDKEKRELDSINKYQRDTLLENQQNNIIK